MDALVDSEGAAVEGVADVTISGEGNEAGKSTSYAAITYDKPGTYTYTITESGDIDGIENDSAAETGKVATVVVEDNKTGALEVKSVTGVTFTNTYKVQ